MNSVELGSSALPVTFAPAMCRLTDEEGVKDVLAQSVLGIWEVVNNLTRRRPCRHERYRVTSFGSARAPRDSWVYAAVRDVAAELTPMNCDIITGGGPGLMEAANDGASLAYESHAERSIVIRVDLLIEQKANAFVTQVFEHGTFFTRLHQFVLVSDAFVVMPGGIGTVLETMMVWQLLQVQKLHNVPLILVGKMYSDLVEWCRMHMLRPKFQLASRQDLEIPVCLDDGPSIVRLLREHHTRWLMSQETTKAQL